MKMKRFSAPTMREAIAKVRSEQGPDAVILSNKRVEGGVEIVTAIDYDESLVQQAQGSPARSAEPEASYVAAAPPAPNAAVEQASVEEPAMPSAKAGFFGSLRDAMRGKNAPASAAADDQAPAGQTRKVASGTATVVERAERPRAAQPAASPPADPTISRMQRQVDSLRQLLESQLSSLAWNDLTRRHPVRARVLNDLIALDIAPDVARRLADEMPALKSANDLSHIAPALLARRLPVVDDQLLEKGGVFAVAGPTGVGKTTTIAKLAARFALRHGVRNVALVSTDGYRIGAREQLHTFARIIGVPMHVAADARELGDVLDSLGPRKLVLIDTAGMSRLDLRLAEQLQALAEHGERIRILLALAANTELAALEATARIFAALKPQACVLTKVDEAGSLGAALSTVMRHQLPIAHLTDGQRVPEDIHAGLARRAWLVRTALKLRERSGRVPDEAVLARYFGKVAVNA
ncbi:MAG: flagellar biosynthesis protein FlhF [Steroidobacteraceae bacterium]